MLVGAVPILGIAWLVSFVSWQAADGVLIALLAGWGWIGWKNAPGIATFVTERGCR
jgi:hypothetical protein